MAEEKTAQLNFTPEVEKAISEATSSEEIRAIATTQPRDDKGQFVAKETPAKVEPKVPDEVKVIKDTFQIGPNQVEFTGESEGDILKQVKVAQQTWELSQKKPEPIKEAPKVMTSDEREAMRLDLMSGKLTPEEYFEKTNYVEQYLEKRGVKVDELKEVIEEKQSRKTTKSWDEAVTGFLADSDWPGGTQNEKLLKYKLAELKGSDGQPLAYVPAVDSLKQAYEALKAEGLLFPAAPPSTDAVRTPPAAQPTTPAPKRAATSSTILGSSRESGTRQPVKAATAPPVTDDMSPTEIMDAWKKGVMAAGEDPNEALRKVYRGQA